MLISFVIPCYRSENTLPDVVETIRRTAEKIPGADYEFVLVNDCSPDNTWQTIVGLAEKYDNVRGVDLAKNSGQQAAILAGLRYSKGDLVAVSDDDGQTPVEETFPDFIRTMEEGNYDVVCAHYIGRGKRGLIRRIGTAANKALVKIFLEKPDDIFTSVYFLAKRFVVDEMIKYNNAYPHMEGLLLRTTHNIGSVPLEQKERASGQSGYNFRKLLRLWVDGLTTFSVKPLRMATFLGSLLALIGFIIVLVLIINRLAGADMASGWTSLIATNILIGGLILTVLGIIGEYIGRIYLSLNHDPQYTVREVIGKNK